MPRKKSSEDTSALADVSTPIAEAQESKDLDQLRSAACRALSHIIELAEADSTDAKLKYDICKWLCEMHFGKPGSSLTRYDACSQPLVLSFEGELEKWSK